MGETIRMSPFVSCARSGCNLMRCGLGSTAKKRIELKKRPAKGLWVVVDTDTKLAFFGYCRIVLPNPVWASNTFGSNVRALEDDIQRSAWKTRCENRAPDSYKGNAIVTVWLLRNPNKKPSLT